MISDPLVGSIAIWNGRMNLKSIQLHWFVATVNKWNKPNLNKIGRSHIIQVRSSRFCIPRWLWCSFIADIYIHCPSLHLVSRLRMHGTIPLLPHTSSWRCTYLSTGTLHSYIFLQIKTRYCKAYHIAQIQKLFCFVRR